MAVDIRMPELASDMIEADLVLWLVAVGDEIDEGDLIAEIETDKATVEFESPVAGVVVELCVPAPTPGVKVGELLARIEPREASEVPAAPPAKVPIANPAEVLDATAAKVAGSRLQTPDPSAADGPRPIQHAGAAAAAQKASPAGGAGAVGGTGEVGGAAPAAATALARRIAGQRGVDLSALAGSGASGRITRADVERADEGAAAQAAPTETRQPDRSPGTRRAPPALSRMMRGTPSAGAEARSTLIEIQCSVEVLEELRDRLVLREGQEPLRCGDFAVAAAARALRDVPGMNVALEAGARVQRDTIDIIVSLSTAGGSAEGLVHGADRLGLVALSQRLRALEAGPDPSDSASDEDSTAAFSVLDVSVHGATRVLPVVPPDQTAILALGAVEELPVVRDDAVVPAKQLRCSLAVDPRAIDADTAARWAAAFRRYLEEPLEMML